MLSLGLIEAAQRELDQKAAAEAEKEAAKAAYLAAKCIPAQWVVDMLDQRAAAKAEKNWAEADRIRDELKEKGIVIKDSKAGATWEIENN